MRSRIFITGANGFLAKQLIACLREKKLINIIYGLYRKPPKHYVFFPFIPLIGDITNPDFGLISIPKIDTLIHCAALVDLSDRHKNEIWRINVKGTQNVIKFCAEHNIPRLVYLSTAYTQGKNTYEFSKQQAEEDILSARATQGLKVTIVKPSIIIGDKENPGTDQTINHVALSIAKVYRKLATAKEKVQDTLVLPPFELMCRIRGDPQATLNVIPVSRVADEIAKLDRKEGTFLITNPNPPLLQEVADEVGGALGVNLRIVKEFKASPPEKVVNRAIKPFSPYLQGEPAFPTTIDKSFSLPHGYIRDMVRAFLSTS